MNPTEKSKLERFVNDEVMSNAVYNLLLSVFLKASTSKDVNTLASERLAINLLRESWKELDRFREIQNQESEKNVQIGL